MAKEAWVDIKVGGETYHRQVVWRGTESKEDAIERERQRILTNRNQPFVRIRQAGSDQVTTAVDSRRPGFFDRLRSAANQPKNKKSAETIKALANYGIADSQSSHFHRSRSLGSGNNGSGGPEYSKGQIVVRDYWGREEDINLSVNDAGDIRNPGETSFDMHLIQEDTEETSHSWTGAGDSNRVLRDHAEAKSAPPSEGRVSYIEMMAKRSKAMAAMEPGRRAKDAAQIEEEVRQQAKDEARMKELRIGPYADLDPRDTW